jgi:hypothetical protein
MKVKVKKLVLVLFCLSNAAVCMTGKSACLISEYPVGRSRIDNCFDDYTRGQCDREYRRGTDTKDSKGRYKTCMVSWFEDESC